MPLLALVSEKEHITSEFVAIPFLYMQFLILFFFSPVVYKSNIMQTEYGA